MSWLISKALMNSLSLQGLAAESLEDTFLDGEQSVPLSGKPIQQAYCAPDKMTEFSRLSRFGMMFKPLTENHGEGLSMSSAVDFHVKTLVRQEKVQELTENEVECGEKWHASFTKYDPDLSLWKTHQCSLLGDLEEFSETWPQWGLMRNGECWERRTLEQTIRGTGYGLLPNGIDKFHTPCTTGLDGGEQQSQSVEKAVITDTRCKPKRPNKGLQPSSEIAIGENTTKLCEEMANTSQHGIQSQPSKAGKSSQWINASGIGNPEWWAVEPNVGRVVDGLASRVVELKALGNGQVPLCAATAWRILNDEN